MHIYIYIYKYIPPLPRDFMIRVCIVRGATHSNIVVYAVYRVVTVRMILNLFDLVSIIL